MVATTKTSATTTLSLGRLALRGSLLELLGYGTGQVLRLGANLLLSRLLFPDAFGLAALVMIIQHGLVMLSDVGIEPCVIQNKRGDEVRFLNTAWTLQVIRGLLLWVVALLLAWPAAALYDEPLLAKLIPVGAINVVLLGLTSTSIITLRRRLAIGRLLLIELGAQVVSLAIMIPWALLAPSVWPLVVGGVGSAAFSAVVSHALPVGYRNRFEWDPSAKDEIVRYGKWIFGSSALFFFSRQADRLLLGRLVGVALLGVYNIALFLSEAVGAAVGKITHGVFHSVFSRAALEGRAHLRTVYYRTRLYLDGAAMTAIGALTVLGDWLVSALYDERYHEAGWMLQALSVRVAMTCMLLAGETCMNALGETRVNFYQNIGRSIWVLAGIPIAWAWWGLPGLIWLIALSELPAFFILWPAMARLGMLRVGLELRGVAAYLVGMPLGYAALRLFQSFAW